MAAHLACANHADRVAVFECRQCHKHVCEDCTDRKWSQKGFTDLCPKCAIPMLELTEAMRAIENAGSAPERGIRGFLVRIPDFLAFPATPAVLMICLGLAIITTPIYWAIGNNMSMFLALIGIVIVKSFELATYFRFVSQTAFGEKPDTLDITDIWDDLIGPLVRYIAACLPIVAAVIWFGDTIGSVTIGALVFMMDQTIIFEFPGPATLYLVGMLLLPLLTVIAAVSRSAFDVLNPAIWLQSLRILGATYAVGALAYYLVLAFEIVFWNSMLLELRLDNPVPFVTPVLVNALTYLSMALRARILGVLCEPYFNEPD